MARFNKSRHNSFMPKQVPTSEFDRIVDAAARIPGGASIHEIARELGGETSHRTLQRWLSVLVADGRLARMGAGRATRYREPIKLKASIQASATLVGALEVDIPVSSDGEAIKQTIRKPIQQRHPVGYERVFLDTYEPNKTFYLSQSIRGELREQGQATSTAELAGTYARKIFDRLLIDLSWNSSRLEGNTYSLLETEHLLELGEAAEGKEAKEAQMILNHKAAIELLVDQADEIGFNGYTILNLHALLADNLLSDPQAVGRLRARAVGIAGTVYHPLEIPPLINECFAELLRKTAAIADPFEQAFFAMVQLPYLQPFEDVNKRVSRLAANIPLIKQNLCPLSFVDVPQRAYVDAMLGVYELNRVELLRDVFVWAYRRSCARYSAVRQSLGEPDRFRLKYRTEIAELVSEIVRGQASRTAAVPRVKAYAATRIPAVDQPRFIEIAETELMNLHEGGIARYRVSPLEFERWQANWR